MMHHPVFSVGIVRCALPPAMVRIVLQLVQPGPAPESRSRLAGTVNLHSRVIRQEARDCGRDRCIYDENKL